MEEMDYQDLRDEVLKTLSFFEPMSLEKIFLDFNKEFLLSYPSFCVEDLAAILRDLKKSKLIKESKEDGQSLWIRQYPNKGLWHMIKRSLRVKWKI